MREFRQPNDEYVFGFSKYLEPIARIAQGEEVVIYTKDAFSGKLDSVDKMPHEVVKMPYANPQTGPFYIEGAEPGDTLVVEFLDIEPARDWAVSCNQVEFGGLCATPTTSMLNAPLPEKTWIYEFDEKKATLTSTTDAALSFPWKPFFGTVTTAPALEVISACTPFNQGGNMDCPDTCKGNKVLLPVAVEGAYFYLGDCHANQGHGELCGVALEIDGKATVKFSVIKNNPINNVRIENDEYMMCVGSAKPMEDAARMAYKDLIKWMGEFGWDEIDAYQALSQCGEMYVGNMVDHNYSLVAKVKKEIVMRKSR